MRLVVAVTAQWRGTKGGAGGPQSAAGECLCLWSCGGFIMLSGGAAGHIRRHEMDAKFHTVFNT